MIRRPPRSTLSSSSAASDVYKRQYQRRVRETPLATMSFFGSLFGSGKPKAPPPPSIDEAIQKLKKALEIMDKKILRENHKHAQLTANIQKIVAVKKSKARTDPKVVAGLKRIKMIEKDIGQLELQRMNVEVRIDSLENAEISKVMVDGYKTAKEAHKEAGLDADVVDDIMLENSELMDEGDEIRELLAEARGPMADIDEDDLDDLYSELMGEGETEDVGGDAIDLPAVGNVTPVMPVAPAPAATTTVAEDEEAEMRALEAEMMAM
eukprot:TRINITY_DN43630_c0_g1_i1.p1 TRINITY_DN43630_c0_g1~~TRINITY_DN43630_c0_g1_i1.p1  ORF type:complete len:266 (+),score=97.45 TRINITY_DN43630_c0_g1_i1:125-922(+)